MNEEARTNDLSKPCLVHLVPDVQHLSLDLLLTRVVSTQHATQLYKQHFTTLTRTHSESSNLTQRRRPT